MAENSNIQWTDATWNPTSGCTKVSPGCTHCYIERTPPMRMAGRKFVAGTIPLQLHEGRLAVPLRWRKPRRVFVNSMSDLFHEDVPDDFLDRVFAVMALAPRHTFQVLTKRAERMAAYLNRRWMSNGGWHRDEVVRLRANERLGEHPTNRPEGWAWPLPNVHLGVSVEDQQRADERIPHLLRTPAAVRFLSCEPLLGPIEFSDVSRRSDAVRQLGKRALAGIHWVIVGGESGHGARPCDLAWVRSLVRQCAAASVPCFVKQLGTRPILAEGRPPAGRNPRVHPEDVPGVGPAFVCHLRDPKGGSPDEWPEDLRVRQFPEAAP
jgi:protein gp37